MSWFWGVGVGDLFLKRPELDRSTMSSSQFVSGMIPVSQNQLPPT